MIEETKHQENYTLNCLKGIACICVVLLHCSLPGSIGQYICGQARFAVPFFFAVSGYFVYNPDQQHLRESIWNKAAHIGRYLLRAELLYFIWHMAYSYVDRHYVSGINEWFAESFTWYNVFRLVLFQRTFVGDVTWFLLALLLCYCVTWAISKFDLWHAVCILMPLLFVVNIAIGEIVPTVMDIHIQWYWVSNFWLLGFPSYVMGCWIRRNEDRLLMISDQTWIWIILASMLLNILEKTFTQGAEFFISSAPVAAATIVICLRHPVIKAGWIGQMLRHIGKYLSFPIYLYHPIVRDVIRMIAIITATLNTLVFRCAMPLLTILLTVGIAELGYQITEFRHRKVS